MDLTFLVDNAPYILILGGAIAISWLLERLVKPVPVVGEPTSWLMKIISLFGFFVGILLIVTAAVAWSMEVPQIDTGTQYLLIVAGLALFLKPLKDIPWAALLGLIVGGLCAGFVFLFYPLPETVYGISSTWIYLLIFFIPALFVYMVFKFIEDVLRLIGSILTFKPVTLVLGLVCIAQGILLLLNTSLFTTLFP
ncbi:MAG: hypothetical protein OEX06_01940 [Candidatus Bathyarchaeota archaeon]|nr:hypothetical protein [Candidatus Bathyarchaeota archaeon]MDH5701803.1 hypothetical protein [Candidatus Bathyarchaeota archaeon]